MAVENSSKWVANGITHLFWGALNSGVPYGVTGALSAGSGAGMALLRSAQNIQIAEPDAARTYVLGDNGVTTSFLQRVQELPGGSLVRGVFDQDFYNYARGSSTTTLEDWDFSSFLTACDNFQDICFIINSPAQAMETANFGESGYQVILVFSSLVQAKILNQLQSAQVQTYNDVLTLKPAGKTLWNTSLSSPIGGYAGLSPYPVTQHVFIGNASADTVTLDYTPAAADGSKVLVWIGGTLKAYTTDYTVNTTTKVLTFASAPANNAICTILYQFLPDC